MQKVWPHHNIRGTRLIAAAAAAAVVVVVEDDVVD